jgi:CheY-like chemotaxis protein
MKRRTVLVVDDSELVRKLTEHTLSRGGYRVITADSADAALEQLATTPEVSLLVTDLVMPGRDGRWLLHAVRRVQDTLPVVLLTGSDDGSDLSDLPSGTVVIGKPFEPTSLLATVGRLLGAHQPH